MCRLKRFPRVLKGVATLASMVLGVFVACAADGRRAARLEGIGEIGFEIHLGYADRTNALAFTERDMDSLCETRTNGVRTLVWRGNAACGSSFEVRATLTRCGEGAWAYAFTYGGNESPWGVRRVRFPCIRVPYAKSTAVLRPFSIGQILRDDWDALADGAWISYIPIANYLAFRFGAFLNEGEPSVYLDWRTRGCDSSEFLCRKACRGKLEACVNYDLPMTPQTRCASDRLFTGELRAYRGGWWEAAQFYRPWAVKQYWYAEAKARRAAVGKLRDVAMWFWNRGASEHVIAPVERFHRDAGVPVALDWYWWHRIPYDTHYPNFWPPREGVSAFRKAVDRLHAQGVYVQVYINGVSRAGDDPTYAADDADQEGRIWHPCARPRSCVYNPYSGCPLVEMCGEAPKFQNRICEVVRHLTEEGGLDAVYVDQIGCTEHAACFNLAHRHAPGDSDGPCEGYRAFLKRMRAENPRAQFSSEDVSESYMGLVDSSIVLWGSPERLSGEIREPVPVYQAIYHEVSTVFGAYTLIDGIPPYDVHWPPERKWKRELDWPRLFPDQFAIEVARPIVFGMQPTVHNLTLAHATDPKLAEDYRFLVAAARIYHANRDLLFDGTLLNPGRVDCERRTARFCRRSTYNADGEYATVTNPCVPAVMHSIWRAPSGRTAALLVNWTRTPQRYRLSSPDLSAEGELPARAWRVFPALEK